MTSSRVCANLGRGLGVVVGCLLGELLLFIIIIHYYYLLLLFWVSGSWHVMDVHAWYKLKTITILPIMTKGLSALTIIRTDRRSQIWRPFERAKTKALELSPFRNVTFYILGMFPLLFIDTSKEEKSEENNSKTC